MEIMLLGKIIDVRFEQSSNIFHPIDVILLYRAMDVILEFENAQ